VHTPEGEKAPFWAYDRVAVVDSDDLDRVWELTNNINSNWTANRGVRDTSATQLRSSCVGDIFYTSDGRFMQVASFGFNEVEMEF
jgi:hypothetical protein